MPRSKAIVETAEQEPLVIGTCRPHNKEVTLPFDDCPGLFWCPDCGWLCEEELDLLELAA